MSHTLLTGILFGLVVATSIVYFEEVREELVKDEDMVKGPFFLVVATAHVLVAIWLLKSPSGTAPHAVIIAGTVGLIILYAATRTDAGAVALGMEGAGGIGHLGIVSKATQACVLVAAVWSLMLSKRPSDSNTSA